MAIGCLEVRALGGAGAGLVRVSFGAAEEGALSGPTALLQGPA